MLAVPLQSISTPPPCAARGGGAARAGLGRALPAWESTSERERRGPVPRGQMVLGFETLRNALTSRRRGGKAPSSAVASSTTEAAAPGTHLVVFANGLWGQPTNWDAAMAKMEPQLPGAVLHVSTVNTLFNTYAGIDGRRLAEEVQEVVRRTPGLEQISFVGHSMGGLLARYAAAQLYDNETRRIAGLSPAHYVSLASPHLGVNANGINQLPLVGWIAGGAPFLAPLVGVLEKVGGPSAQVLLGRTGAHLFLHDKDGSGGQPLLVRMACDDSFLDPLRAFETRTLFANADGDHLVGWANSSLRRVGELPEVDAGLGVVRDDARHGPAPPALLRGGGGGGSGGGRAGAGAGGGHCEDMLEALQRLGWRRIDCSWKASGRPYFAHNNIQVSRWWLHSVGEGVVDYLCAVLRGYEEARPPPPPIVYGDGPLPTFCEAP